MFSGSTRDTFDTEYQENGSHSRCIQREGINAGNGLQTDLKPESHCLLSEPPDVLEGHVLVVRGSGPGLVGPVALVGSLLQLQVLMRGPGLCRAHPPGQNGLAGTGQGLPLLHLRSTVGLSGTVMSSSQLAMEPSSAAAVKQGGFHLDCAQCHLSTEVSNTAATAGVQESTLRELLGEETSSDPNVGGEALEILRGGEAVRVEPPSPNPGGEEEEGERRHLTSCPYCVMSQASASEGHH
ncbi:hypothetical protein H920_07414 [Fukomys damarensis]|uniref:Uncharacterized protein n=1 Tax=Fukomys damarensis TaxID=885580 RepID=A0A091DLB4_FUKDA|nr:hypothetical protein H920_07414 [Fukomys damarensis]